MSEYVVIRLSKSELALILNALGKYAGILYAEDRAEEAKPYIMLLQQLREKVKM